MNNNQETKQATVVQPFDLIALATRVVERNRCNQQGNSTATNTTAPPSADTVALPPIQSCQVASTKEGNLATIELRDLIRDVYSYYSGNNDLFIDAFIKTILMHNDIENATACFRNMANQTLLKNDE